MNDELTNLQRRMEQATAPAGSPKVPLDDETASLREAWLALGERLEAAQPAESQEVPLRLPPARPRWRQRASLAMVAAGLAVGLTLAWSLLPKQSADGVPGRSVARPGVEKPAPAAPNKPAETTATVPRNETPSDFPPAWDDPLDDRIASAADALFRIQQDWGASDAGYVPVVYGMEEIEDDLGGSTL